MSQSNVLQRFFQPLWKESLNSNVISSVENVNSKCFSTSTNTEMQFMSKSFLSSVPIFSASKCQKQQSNFAKYQEPFKLYLLYFLIKECTYYIHINAFCKYSESKMSIFKFFCATTFKKKPHRVFYHGSLDYHSTLFREILEAVSIHSFSNFE